MSYSVLYMNVLPCIEKVLIINYMTQLTIYFFLNNFLCVFDKCGLFTLAIFRVSVKNGNRNDRIRKRPKPEIPA
jgi:hypothetical protein